MATATNTFPTIRVSQIPQLLELSAKSRRPAFFLSNPGVGKTSQVDRFCKERNIELIVLVASMLDRSDFQLPVLNKETGAVEFVALDTMRDLSEEFNPNGGPTLLYWNELNASPESLQPVLYRLLNENKLGKLTLRKNVFQVADGNPTIASSVANELPMPSKRRFRWFQVAIDHGEWLEWAQGDGSIHPVVSAFISYQPAALSDFDPSRYDAITYASPASYEYLSRDMDAVLNMPVDLAQAVICGDIGESAGMQMAAFLQNREKIGSLEPLFADPARAVIPAQRDLRFLLSGLLVHRAQTNPEDFDAAAILAHKILEVDKEIGFFTVRTFLKSETLKPRIRKTPAFKEIVKLVAGAPDIQAALFL